VKLTGVIETDEFYIKAGLKGRPYHDEILNSGRLPRDRWLKAWKGRGIFDKDTPMIICVHQRGEGMTYFDVHDTKQPLISKIRRLIDHHTKVYTDEYLAYGNLKKYGFVHTPAHVLRTPFLIRLPICGEYKSWYLSYIVPLYNSPSRCV
jgi:hypothetical protein